ncbi:aldo/keto reductase [Halorussus gelatinilyticus]|uniref:Aldo/keto reductase n=1 Tax=Halorussus gelatinilyticus TaxID=2937524 RepID=A0A8U0INP3_9EURY|nr:aldo/keto reductase [Halorussus gelatinilyticus]UPW02255.1 aldo/keto reductase [Halorussus gelatinilyticus]
MVEVSENQSDTFDIGGELTVHRLAYGAMRLTGEDIIGRPDDEDEARDVVRRAVEMNVDFVDTADSYGPGVSERIVREAIDPDEAVVGTKAGLLRNRSGDWIPHGGPDYFRNQVLCSLDRLGVESIDLYQLHTPDVDCSFEDAVNTFAELKDDGLVDHVGLSNVSVEQLDEARDMVEVATVQNEYNVGNRDHEDVLEACEDAGIGFISYFPIGGGDLGDKESVLKEVADDHDATPRQVALAWLLQHSPVTIPIPGTSSVDHLEQNVAASAVELSDDEMARLGE